MNIVVIEGNRTKKEIMPVANDRQAKVLSSSNSCTPEKQNVKVKQR